jgi:fatty-acyl-CoA synthase
MAEIDVRAELAKAERGGIPALDYRDLLTFASATRPQAKALVLDGRELTFADLDRLSVRAAEVLARYGAMPGDRVGLLGSNAVEWLALALGALRADCTVVPINARYTVTEISALVRRADLSLVFAQPRFGRRDLSDYLLQFAPEAPARICTFDGVVDGIDNIDLMVAAQAARVPEDAEPGTGACASSVGMTLFTSGSTSTPKGCMLTQAGMIRNAALHTERLGITTADRWFSPMPFYHAGGFVWGVTSMLVTGACLISQSTFDAGRALDLIDAYQPTYHHGLDTMFIAEMEHPAFATSRTNSIRIANSTGGRPVLERISEKMGIPGTVSKWGITEGYGNLTLSAPTDPRDKRLETVGRRYPGIDYAIGVPGRSGIGEILIRNSVMEGYFRDQGATAEVIDAEGWLHTGDLGAFDDEGYLHYAGRIKQMLKVGGENVSALEIEGLLLGYPGVTAVAVVGRKHPRLGEVPIAVVEVSSPSARTSDGLHLLCRENLAPFKVPADIILLGPGEMPLTGSGKLDGPRIRELVEVRS